MIKDYGDIPYVTRQLTGAGGAAEATDADLERQAADAEERKQIERILARKKTLAEVARARLDEMDNLVVGKPAPAIDGIDMDGKPLEALRLPRQGRRARLLGHLVRPVHGGGPPRARAGRAATRASRSPCWASTATTTRTPRSR